MEISTSSNTSNIDFQTVVEQESLSNDDFMQLLLTELKYQDPTDPMDSKSMLDQTLQMSTIEANNSNVKALANLESSYAATERLSSIDLIGKYIETGDQNIELEDSVSNFSVFFAEDVSSGTIDIKDDEGQIVASLEISSIPSGTMVFNWDGTGTNGEQLSDGTYSTEVSAFNLEGKAMDAKSGIYQVSSLEFTDGDIIAVSGSNKININDVDKVW